MRLTQWDSAGIDFRTKSLQNHRETRCQYRLVVVPFCSVQRSSKKIIELVLCIVANQRAKENTSVMKKDGRFVCEKGFATQTRLQPFNIKGRFVPFIRTVQSGNAPQHIVTESPPLLYVPKLSDVILPALKQNPPLVLHTSKHSARPRINKLDYIAQFWRWMSRRERGELQMARRTSAKRGNGLTPGRSRPNDSGKVQKRPLRRRGGAPRSRNPQARDEQRHDRRSHPEDFPDLDFHQSFGSFLTRKNPVDKTVDREIAGYWRSLTKTPSMMQYHIFDIREYYQAAFQRYFTAEVMSVHGHVSDAANPNLLMSLLLHLMDVANGMGSDSASSSASDSASGSASSSASSSTSSSASEATEVDVDLLEHANKKNPRIALAHGAYGAVFGPMAYQCVLPYARPLANGPEPFIINTQTPDKISRQVKKAKAEGCIALIVEIVRAADGSVISDAAWKHLVNACRKHCLVLIVDEALTAIRCGAPFAYQLPRYAKSGLPDLVLFGKAVRTNGIAVEWRGINIQKLGIDNEEDRSLAILHWQDRFTALATAQDLLASWGTLILAGREHWATRAPTIGRLLRNILRSEGIRPQLIRGLHGLIYIRQKDYVTASPIMVANAGSYVRLLPTMDEIMTYEGQLLTKVFGANSVPHRAELAGFLQRHDLELHWCSKCGAAVNKDTKNECNRCVVSQCEECEPGDHICPM